MSQFPWADIDDSAAAPPDAIAQAFAATFGSGVGEEVLAHLRRLTVECTLPPDVSEAVLRHMEGQRHLVKLIETLIERGRQ